MGHFDVVWFLAEKGADLKAPHKDHVGGGHNALILSAVRHRSVEALQKLKAHGVDLDTRHWNGNSALHEAARSGEKEIVAWLVKSGANISAINDSGEGPVAEAASMGDPHSHPHPRPCPHPHPRPNPSPNMGQAEGGGGPNPSPSPNPGPGPEPPP